MHLRFLPSPPNQEAAISSLTSLKRMLKKDRTIAPAQPEGLLSIFGVPNSRELLIEEPVSQ